MSEKKNPKDNLYIPSEPFSYKNIKNDLLRFRNNRDALDTPGHLFFKVFFHFWNGDAYGPATDSLSLESGLLAPTWDWGGKTNMVQQRSILDTEYKQNIGKQEEGNNVIAESLQTIQMSHHNSAYNFLIRNDELERADKLKQFIMLLSNISTNCPWYFQEITGLEELLAKPYGKPDEPFKVEAPKQITIKCLPDAQDDRISTMLDLYRDVAFSNIHHKEILPANLRKFDMSIYIFSSPVANLHLDDSEIHYTVASMATPASYKCIELHDCEIDYNYKGYYASVNNTEGFDPTVEIALYVGEANEIRYNAYIDRLIGDIVKTDLFQTTYASGKLNQIYESEPQYIQDARLEVLMQRVNGTWTGLPETEKIGGQKLGKLQGYPGLVAQTQKITSVNPFKLVDDLTGNVASDFIKSQILGNISKYDLDDLATNLKKLGVSISSGSIGGAIASVGNLTQISKGWYVKEQDPTTDSNIYTRAEGQFAGDREAEVKTDLGKIY